MPLYDMKCINGHYDIAYYRDSRDKRIRTHVCELCGNTMTFVISLPGRFRFFSEKSPQIITNMGHEPVEIRSHAQHQAEMKKRGLGWATPKRGNPGSWA